MDRRARPAGTRAVAATSRSLLRAPAILFAIPYLGSRKQVPTVLEALERAIAYAVREWSVGLSGFRVHGDLRLTLSEVATAGYEKTKRRQAAAVGLSHGDVNNYDDVVGACGAQIMDRDPTTGDFFAFRW